MTYEEFLIDSGEYADDNDYLREPDAMEIAKAERENN